MTLKGTVIRALLFENIALPFSKENAKPLPLISESRG